MADEEVYNIQVNITAKGAEALSQLDRLRRGLRDLDQSSSTANVRREMTNLERVAFQVGHELGTTFRLLGVTSSLIGGGLVAGIAAAGVALANFGRSGLELHATSRELGVTAEALSRYQYAAQAAGMSSEQAESGTRNAIRSLQELGRRGAYSELYQALSKGAAGISGNVFAARLLEEVRSGGPEQAFKYLLGRLKDFSESGNTAALSLVQKLVGFGEGQGAGRIADLIERIGHVTVVSAKDAQEYQLQMVILGLQMNNLKTVIGNALLPTFERLFNELGKWLERPEGKEFVKSIEDMAKSLEKLPWAEIEKNARIAVGNTVSFLGAAAKDIKDFYSSAVENYDRFLKLKKSVEDSSATDVMKFLLGTHPVKPSTVPGFISDLIITEIRRQLGKSSGGTGGGGEPIELPTVDVPSSRRFHRRRGGGGNNDQIYRFSGGGADVDDRKTTTDLADQMKDVTDEVRRLNDILRGEEATGRGVRGGGAGGMGSTGAARGRLLAALGGGGTGGGGGLGRRARGGGGSDGDEETGSGGTGGGTSSNPMGRASSRSSKPFSASDAPFSGPAGTGAEGGITLGDIRGAIYGDVNAGTGKAISVTDIRGAVVGSGGGGAAISGPGASLYNKLKAAYEKSGLVGTIPKGGERFGFKTGSADEWARFGAAVANEESSFNPQTKNPGDTGGSWGVFQYAHGQVPGGNAFDVDASVDAFVRDSKASVEKGIGITNSKDPEGSILDRRFATIGNHPERAIRSLGVGYKLGEGGGGSSVLSTGGQSPSVMNAIAGVKNFDPSKVFGAGVGGGGGLPTEQTEKMWPGRGQMGKVEGLVLHHTGEPSRGTASSWAGNSNRFYAQWIMDRDGKVFRATKEGQEAWHFGGSVNWNGQRLSNKNMEGLEIMASGENDYTDAQREALGPFIGAHSRQHGYDPMKTVIPHAIGNTRSGMGAFNRQTGLMNPKSEGGVMYNALHSGQLNLGAPAPTAVATAPTLGSGKREPGIIYQEDIDSGRSLPPPPGSPRAPSLGGGSGGGFPVGTAFGSSVKGGIQLPTGETGQAALDKIPKIGQTRVGLTNAVAQERDAESDRSVMNGALVRAMAAQEMTGRAKIDIDVNAGKKDSGADDANLFNKTRSKTGVQMPNTPSNTDGDKSGKSSEDSSTPANAEE